MPREMTPGDDGASRGSGEITSTEFPKIKNYGSLIGEMVTLAGSSAELLGSVQRRSDKLGHIWSLIILTFISE